MKPLWIKSKRAKKWLLERERERDVWSITKCAGVVPISMFILSNLVPFNKKTCLKHVLLTPLAKCMYIKLFAKSRHPWPPLPLSPKENSHSWRLEFHILLVMEYLIIASPPIIKSILYTKCVCEWCLRLKLEVGIDEIEFHEKTFLWAWKLIYIYFDPYNQSKPNSNKFANFSMSLEINIYIYIYFDPYN
jgi:hypothetical protein